jgi:hypothetical protein
LGNVKDVDVLVMVDDLTLVDTTTPLAHHEPVGTKWGGRRLPKEALEKARAINGRVLEERLKRGSIVRGVLGYGEGVRQGVARSGLVRG